MTEDEAKTKACCGPRNNANSDVLCIASACMAWRWVQSGEPPATMTVPQAAAWKHGYCGLAARPS